MARIKARRDADDVNDADGGRAAASGALSAATHASLEGGTMRTRHWRRGTAKTFSLLSFRAVSVFAAHVITLKVGTDP